MKTESYAQDQFTSDQKHPAEVSYVGTDVVHIAGARTPLLTGFINCSFEGAFLRCFTLGLLGPLTDSDFLLPNAGSTNCLFTITGFVFDSDSGSGTERIVPLIKPWCTKVLCSNLSRCWISMKIMWERLVQIGEVNCLSDTKPCPWLCSRGSNIGRKSTFMQAHKNLRQCLSLCRKSGNSKSWLDWHLVAWHLDLLMFPVSITGERCSKWPHNWDNGKISLR